MTDRNRAPVRLGLAAVSGHDQKPRLRGKLSGSMMAELRYEAPQTLQAAVALLAGASGTTRVLAGGTDVIVQMETDLIEPQLLVDIKKIAEVREIVEENGGVCIRAAGPRLAIVDHTGVFRGLAGGV